MRQSPLSAGAYGDNVASLQRVLVQGGFQIPDSEVRRKFFGPATREAVLETQAGHELSPTGVVDENLSFLDRPSGPR
jgi:hypothetical protein